jgi:6-phosphogluconolactonase
MPGWRLLIGGYTQDVPGEGLAAQGEPEPVRLAALDADRRFQDLGRLDAGVNPSWIARHPSLPVAYACTEDFTPGVQGSVTAWDLAGPELTMLARAGTGGHAPCHIGVVLDDAVSALIVSHYVGSQVTLVPLDEAGRPAQAPSDVVLHSGASGAVPERQEAPHPHQAVWDPIARLAWVCDLGQDRVIGYELRRGRLREAAELVVAAGFGPRHIAPHPSLGAMALIGELANQVAVYRRGEAAATWVETDRRSTLPPNWPGASGAAAIRWNSPGTRLYASNRGHDSLAVWSFSDDGRLTALGYCPVAAEPRDLVLSQDGHWALVAAQSAHRVVAYPIAESGLLGSEAHSMPCASPSRVALIDRF